MSHDTTQKKIELENSYTKYLEKFLGVEDLRFNDEITEDRDIYFGKHIKRSLDYRKEIETTHTFPKYISFSWTKNGERFGIKFQTKDFIESKEYQYEKEDVVDAGDGLIYKNITLPYLFLGTSYYLNRNKVVDFLKSKITNHP